MKKNHLWGCDIDLLPILSKLLQIMKLSIVLTFVFTLNAAASVYSQQARFDFMVDNMTIRDVLKIIENKSQFRFFYNDEFTDLNKTITYQFTDKSIDDILSCLLDEGSVSYKVLENNLVVITPKGLLQQQKVTGTVTDANSGEPLPGVYVRIEGTQLGSITDSDGKYSVEVPDNKSILTFSFIGYNTESIAVGGKNVINISLIADITALEEVVVIGYGVVKKSDLTGSVAQVKSEAINSFPSTNVMQALTGRAPGVQVIQNDGTPGGAIAIRVRGANSIQGNNDPLYIIDGFPGSPTILNNSDIESIEVLKDASATAIYGSRGANGVVLITTKRGKEGKTSVDFESSYSSQSLIKKLDLMNAKEYAQFYNIQQLNDVGSAYFSQDEIDGFGEGTDWWDLITQTAPIYNSSLNINSGNEKTKFAISGSVLSQDGVIKKSDYNRYSVRTNVDHKFGKLFSATLSSTLTRVVKETTGNSGSGNRGNSLISAAIGAPPTLTPYDENGNYSVLRSAYPFVATDLLNPVNYLKERDSETISNYVLINGALMFNPVPQLTIKIAGGIENSDSRSDGYVTRDYENSEGSASVNTSQYTSLLNENTISYNQTFHEKHSFTALAGFTYQDFLTKSMNASGVGFVSDNFESYDLSAASTPGIPNSSYTKSALLSYLARANYSYSEKYLFTVSFRADGASKFSEGNKWGYFPSAAIAWRVSEEDFIKNIKLISNLKLRSSWGLTGSQAIDAYATLSQLYSYKVAFGDDLYTCFSPSTAYPGDLKWETTEQFDLGLDLGILSNRLSFTADYYIKNTRDLLNTVVLPSSMGYTSSIQNIGKVQNKGFELGVDALVFTGNFKWDLNTNLSFNRNKVVKLYNGEDITGGTTGLITGAGTTNILSEGQPIGRFYGYKEDGYDENGYIKFVDFSADGTISNDDRTYIGDPNPDFTFGLNSNMSYKNFELSIFVQGTYGNDLYNASKIAYAYDYGYGLNMIKEVLNNHWTEETPNAKYPKISYYTTYKVSDRFVEDGSYLRLKNIQLTYNLPVQKLGTNWIKYLQIYVSGQNLLTLTRYSGWDPEVNYVPSGSSASTTYGIDYNRYPMSKTYTVGLRVRF